MKGDYYKYQLKSAQYSWLEHKCHGCKHFIGGPRRKDRVSGRVEKRRAQRLERRFRESDE